MPLRLRFWSRVPRVPTRTEELRQETFDNPEDDEAERLLIEHEEQSPTD